MGKHDKKKGNNDKHNHKHKDDNLADDASLDVAEPEKIVETAPPSPTIHATGSSRASWYA